MSNFTEWPEGLDITDVVPFGRVADIVKLASDGLSPRDIAVAIGLDDNAADAFCRMAPMPGSPVFRLMERGRTEGRKTALTKLSDVAREGNIDAVKALAEIQAASRHDELINYMDDDEFTG